MVIIKRGIKAGQYDIKSKQLLVSYINFILEPKNLWIGIGSNLNIESIINTNIKISHTSFMYNFYYKLNFASKTIYSVEYWLDRGYNKKYAKEQISNIQAINSKKCVEKRRKNPEIYKSKYPIYIEYWINKGYSIDNAKTELSNYQHTFSLKKCVDKYGKEEGLSIFNNRQLKWQNSLKLTENVTWKQSDKAGHGNSNEYLYKTYGNNWILRRIDILKQNKKYLPYTKKLKLINHIVYEKQLDLLDYLLQHSYYEVYKFSKISVVLFLLKLTSTELLSKWCKYNKVRFVKGTIGNMYYFEGDFYKSNKEFLIGKWLKNNNIKFNVNKPYPNSTKCYDFYIKDLNLYIEYLGMKQKDYNDKLVFLKNSNLNVYWSNSIKHIKKAINEKICKLEKN